MLDAEVEQAIDVGQRGGRKDAVDDQPIAEVARLGGIVSNVVDDVSGHNGWRPDDGAPVRGIDRVEANDEAIERRQQRFMLPKQ